MLTPVTCPACQHKFTIPEGDMGKRHVCPNCQCPFLAGKSVSEAGAPVPSSLAAMMALPAEYARTMLAEAAPPIKYNCPRCKAPLEAPASEAGTKKNCPACSQKLQVPAAPPPPPPAAGQPDLNKTLLAEDASKMAPPIKYNCPKCKKPFESPASEAGTKKNCPACGQRFQVPAAPSGAPELNKTLLAADESKPAPAGLPAAYPPAAYATTAAPALAGSAVPGGVFQIGSVTVTRQHLAIAAAVLFLLIVVPAIIRGGKTTDVEAAAKAQQELEKVKAEIETKKAEVKRHEQFEEQIRRQLDEISAKLRHQDDQMRDNHRLALRAVSDEKTRAQLEEKFAEERRRFEEEKRQREKEQQKILADAKAAADASKKQLEEAQQRQQTIIHQPAPVYYYPPYHYRYYWWWW